MNRSALWFTLLFVAFFIAVPVLELSMADDPLPVAAGKYFRRGIDLQGGTNLVYDVAGRATTNMEMVVSILQDRVNPTGTRDVIIQPVAGDKRISIIIPAAGGEQEHEDEVATVKSLVTRSGFLRFAILANPANMSDADAREAAETRRQGGSAPEYHMWVPVKWNSKVNWPRVRQVLGFPDGVTREQAMGMVKSPGAIYVMHKLGAEGRMQTQISIVDDEQDEQTPEAGEPSAETPNGAGQSTSEETAVDEEAPGEGEAATEAADADETDVDRRDTVEVSDVEVLVRTDTPRVTGDDFATDGLGKTTTPDDGPVVSFDMKTSAYDRLSALTGENVGERMGIILDGKLQGAPNIKTQLTSGGIISGYDSSEERDEVLTVLQSGALPVSLSLIEQRSVGPELGADNIRKGMWASLVSLCAVLAFMAVYYLFAGLVADVAVVLNLVIIIVVMHLMKGTWTLPGIAGLILTVGMSVDANVLIFERIREELGRGSSIRLALRNGYSKAMPAIIDGNLTTFFTAVILAWFGGQALKGFAVVLIIGIISSMFTSLLVTRSIFEIIQGAGLLRRLPMLRLIKSPNVRFTRIARVTFWISVVLVVAGITASFATGEEKFDIEFRGGTMVELKLDEPMDIEAVRQRVAELDRGYRATVMLEESISLEDVRRQVQALGGPFADALVFPVGDRTRQMAYGLHLFSGQADQVETRLSEVLPAKDVVVVSAGSAPMGYETAVVQPIHYGERTKTNQRYMVQVVSDQDQRVEGALRAHFSGVLAKSDEMRVSVEGTVLTKEMVLEWQNRERGPAPQTAPEEPDAATEAGDDDRADAPAEADEPADGEVADADADGQQQAETETSDADEDAANGEAADGESEEPVAEVVEVTSSKLILDEFEKYVGSLEARVELIDGSATPSEIRSRIAQYLRNTEPDKAGTPIEIKPGEPAEGANQYRTFTLHVRDDRFNAAESSKVRLAKDSWLGALRQAISRPPALVSNKISERVGSRAWQHALMAMVLALLIIIGYIWFRFARVTYGFAAVCALIHDVSVVLGLVLLFSWFGRNIPFIGEMKIDLPMIGAFLTLIGYSLNDTIVVFDRIRENRGKFGELSESVVNNSINQTLSRTILTSFTTFAVVTILYFFGGVQSTVHGFSFVLAMGVIVGTYSSIFIASPLLLWLASGKRKGALGK